VGLIGCGVTCYALLRWGGWFAVMGFLCNGGLAGWKYFHHWGFRIEDYQQAVDWKSIPLSMFVTQRGLLYAIPAGVLLLAAVAGAVVPEGCVEGAGGADAGVGAGGAVRHDAALPHAHVYVFSRRCWGGGC